MNEGLPIHVLGAEIGLDVDIVIITGETEDSLALMVKPLLDKGTRITDRRSDKRN
jgi:hypothetical protein